MRVRAISEFGNGSWSEVVGENAYSGESIYIHTYIASHFGSCRHFSHYIAIIIYIG